MSQTSKAKGTVRVQPTEQPTEQRNTRTRGIDDKSVTEILRAIHREDESVASAVAKAIPQIARAVAATVKALQSGGRLFYVGAGTSGRLATLDAAEIPPTFGTPAHLVQAIMAGGRRALTSAAEGTEDNKAQGARDLRARGIGRRDVVIGITASGSTPYVLGALEYAKRRGAITVGVTSDPRTPIVQASRIRIITLTGPETITGSTRMKAGTAHKMVLNMLSTAVMIRLGRVYDNWMIGVALTNQKLRARGLRILGDASGCSVAASTQALRQAEHRVGRNRRALQNAGVQDLQVALLMLKSGVSANQAAQLLRKANGNIRVALIQQKQISKTR